MPLACGAPAAWITLTDRSQLLATAFTVTGTDAKVALLGGGTVIVPTAIIDTVRFRDHADPLPSNGPKLSRPIARPTCWSSARTRLSISSAACCATSPPRRSSSSSTAGCARSNALKSTACFIIVRPARPWPPRTPRCATPAARSGKWNRSHSPQSRCSCDTAAGLEMIRPASDVARLDFSQGNVQYLSELKPESIVWTPYLGRAEDSPAVRLLFQPRHGSCRGRRPAAARRPRVRQGIVSAQPHRDVVPAAGKVPFVSAIAGIDDCARPAGNVRLQILADDRTLFDESLSGKDAPRSLELDLSGANRLKFVVDFGLDQGTGDWLDLCEARILK